MADALDSKSNGGNIVRVQVPPAAKIGRFSRLGRPQTTRQRRASSKSRPARVVGSSPTTGKSSERTIKNKSGT